MVIERGEGFAQVVLNRPERRNALNQDLLTALAVALDEVRDDASVRVVVLKGRGPVFSSGIDHSLLGEVFQKSQGVPFRHLHGDRHAVLNRLTRMEKPVIAVLHRAAVGMALELALAADLRIATADCVMGLPEVAFGIVPDVGGTTRLTRLVGTSRAKELILTGRLITGKRAEALGLVNVVVDSEADLEGEVATWVAAMTTHPPAAVGLAKSLIDHVAEVSTDTALRMEGVYQSLLLARPELFDHFPTALAFIQSQMKNPLR